MLTVVPYGFDGKYGVCYHLAMPEHYAELTLYFGYCHQDGRGEGKFDPNSDVAWVRMRYAQAVNNISIYLTPGWEFGLNIGYSEKALVGSEAEAKALIDYVEVNIPNARGLVVPHDAIHGTVRFWRKIRIDGVTAYMRDGLIAELKKSGYKPKDNEREHRASILRHYLPIAEVETRLQEMGLDEDRMWRNSLVFR